MTITVMVLVSFFGQRTLPIQPIVLFLVLWAIQQLVFDDETPPAIEIPPLGQATVTVLAASAETEPLPEA